MPDLVSFEVGKTYPYPHPGDGMQAVIEPEDGLALMLAAVCDKPSPKEMTALREGPLRVAVLPSAPLTWLVLDAGALSYDAPYAVGIAGAKHQAAILAAAAATQAFDENLRGLLHLVVIDRGTIVLNRVISTSRSWWRVLAASIVANGAPLEAAAYRRAIAADQARMTTMQMLRAAAIVEIAGAV